jgi:tRNA uridine 5-carboxymethylaminomethyl modification enzyme
MIDDLTTQGVSEPYRMFTSRAEYRLTLRADNADMRLTRLGTEWGCVGAARQAVFAQDVAAIDSATRQAEEQGWQPQELARMGMKIAQDGRRRSLLEILGYGTDEALVRSIAPWFMDVPSRARQYIVTQARYSGYLVRQQREIRQLEVETEIRFPADMDFAAVGGLSAEMRERLEAARPDSFSAAQRIKGVTPSALMAVLAYLRKEKIHARAV